MLLTFPQYTHKRRRRVIRDTEVCTGSPTFHNAQSRGHILITTRCEPHAVPGSGLIVDNSAGATPCAELCTRTDG